MLLASELILRRDMRLVQDISYPPLIPPCKGYRVHTNPLIPLNPP